MPRLALEPVTYPEDLFGQQVMEDARARRWWVLHTRPRAEKSVARKLLKQRLAFFLPVYEHFARARGRVRSAFVPLFPGYVFLFGDLEARWAALQTNQVARVLAAADQDQLRNDLRRIYQLVTSGEALDPVDRLVPGRTVEITCGPFAGVQGKIVRRGKQLRLFVEVQFLQRGVSVEVETWMIRPLEDLSRAIQTVATLR